MYVVAINRNIGIFDVRARARMMPSGRDSEMATTDSTMVRRSPPRNEEPATYATGALAAERRCRQGEHGERQQEESDQELHRESEGCERQDEESRTDHPADLAPAAGDEIEDQPTDHDEAKSHRQVPGENTPVIHVRISQDHEHDDREGCDPKPHECLAGRPDGNPVP
jgi:hypothetical protein